MHSPGDSGQADASVWPSALAHRSMLCGVTVSGKVRLRAMPHGTPSSSSACTQQLAGAESKGGRMDRAAPASGTRGCWGHGAAGSEWQARAGSTPLPTRLGSPVMTVRAEKSTRFPIRLPRTRPSLPASGRTERRVACSVGWTARQDRAAKTRHSVRGVQAGWHIAQSGCGGRPPLRRWQMDLMGRPLRCLACGMPGRLLSMYLQSFKGARAVRHGLLHQQ